MEDAGRSAKARSSELGLEIDDGDPRALLGEPARDRGADAVGGAGDHRDGALETVEAQWKLRPPSAASAVPVT